MDVTTHRSPLHDISNTCYRALDAITRDDVARFFPGSPPGQLVRVLPLSTSVFSLLSSLLVEFTIVPFSSISRTSDESQFTVSVRVVDLAKTRQNSGCNIYSNFLFNNKLNRKDFVYLMAVQFFQLLALLRLASVYDVLITHASLYHH